MFVREKTARGHRYLYLVESVRDGGRVRQQIVRALGRKDVLLARGELDRLAASLARHSERAMILSEMDAGRLSCTRIGGPLLFGRLWERLGIADVLADLLRGRGFDFAVERAVFVAVLHRLFVSGSDRACEKWMADYAIPGADGLQLHHFYRAMAWLGEETGPAGDDALAPRCVKDIIEEELFARRRDLFSELSLVFMDTTTLSFQGAGGETLGAHGHSKDHRPDLKQMVLAVVIDGEGRPICTEMLPGNTADVTVLLPVVDRLRERFAVGRICVVADRGMIAKATIAALEARGLEYILGTRRAPPLPARSAASSRPRASRGHPTPATTRPDPQTPECNANNRPCRRNSLFRRNFFQTTVQLGLDAAGCKRTFGDGSRLLARPCHRPVEVMQLQAVGTGDGIVGHPLLAGEIQIAVAAGRLLAHEQAGCCS